MRARTFRRRELVAAMGAFLPWRAIATASGLPPATGEILFSVTGRVTRTNRPGEVDLDRALLERIGLVELVTATPHTEGRPVWRGVPLSRLLAAVGAEGAEIYAIARNGYRVVIPMADVQAFDPLVAIERDGKEMRVRDKGPGWIIYPWDRYAELANAVFSARSIWQLRELRIE